MPQCHSLLALAALCLVSLGASCDRAKKAESGVEEARATSEGSAAAPAGERVESLAGVDVSELTDAEVDVWRDLINERLSPCGDPVSVGRCVADKHKCGACVTAARYLTRLVMEGYDKQTIESHYTGRFDKDKRLEVPIEDAHVRGAPMAPVSIVEFSDFQCPYCGAAYPELERIVQQYEGRVKLVFKHYPLPAHPRAMPAAKAAEAAGRQGKFFEMHDILFQNQRKLEDGDLKRYAEMLGLDAERFAADMASEEVAARVAADRKLGEKLGVEGTPSIYVNGRKFEEPLKALPAYLAEELEL
jgi:2-hydroxychromene-2-carboxylate isomerase